jgi:hypothetical protein
MTLDSSLKNLLFSFSQNKLINIYFLFNNLLFLKDFLYKKYIICLKNYKYFF